MNDRSVVTRYAVITITLLIVVSISQWCFDVSGVASTSVHGLCVATWAIGGILLALSQVAFFVIAWRIKQDVVFLVAAAILVLVGVFMFALSNMPS